MQNQLHNILLLVFISCCTQNTYSQKDIEVSSDRDEETGAITLTVQNNTFAIHTVTFDFSVLQNLSSPLGGANQIIAYPGRHKAATLRRVSENQSTSLQYTYRYRKGCYNAKAERDFIYLLPVNHTKTTKVLSLTNLGEKYGNESPPKDWFALGFTMECGDTIRAARRGTVVEIVDNVQESDKDGVTYARSRNSVEIEHPDCSYGRYELFDENSLFVQLGQSIYPGDALGLAGGSNYNSGCHVRFSTFYSHEEEILKNKESSGRKHYWAYIPMKFLVDKKSTELIPGSEYVSQHLQENIIMEMSNREIKKRKKANRE